MIDRIQTSSEQSLENQTKMRGERSGCRCQWCQRRQIGQEGRDVTLYVILLHLWGSREYTKEQFQWNGAYSKQIGED